VSHRVCEDCGEEFRPEIERCSDCGGRLRHPEELESAGRAAESDPAADAAALAALSTLFVSSQATQLVPLADRLRDEGIPFRLVEEMGDPERRTARYSLCVGEADRERAVGAIAPLIDGETDPGLLRAVESRFDETGRYGRCPACDSEMPEGAAECPDCGLAVAAEPDAPERT
jgi:hypothetical protein